MFIDMWNGDKLTDCDGVQVSFYPNDGKYRGNILKNGRFVGDFVAVDSVEVEKTFAFMGFSF